MVESTEERAHDLFLLGPAENVCIGRNVCAVACMVVIVDHGTRIMKEACSHQECTHTGAESVDMLPLIEHGKGKGSDITGMECVLPGNRMEIILDRIDQHMLALIPVLVINRIIVMEEEPFTKAAAGDRKIRRLGFPDDFLNSQGACNDDISALGRKAADALALFEGLGGNILYHFKKIFGRQVVIMQFWKRIPCASLVDFRKVSDSSSDSYDWKRRVREPGDFIELGLNEFFHFSKL